MLPRAVAIPLPFWQDPQGSLALAMTTATCEVFFALWQDMGEELPGQLGKVTFSRCWATRTLATEFLPYAAEPHGFHSYLLEVPASAWLATAPQQRLHTYPTWQPRDTDTYHHYVVQGANSFLEVLAADFTTSLASAAEYQRYSFLQE